MEGVSESIIARVVDGSSEPTLLARIDLPDWPCVLANAAFSELTSTGTAGQRPFADVIEEILGREIALEVSESIRQGEETTIPVEVSGRDYLLALKPLRTDGNEPEQYCVAYWRNAAGATSGVPANDAQQALLRAKRRIRDLSREDAVTGLLNARAFREVLEHDWAVAAREKSRLAVVAFTLDDFDQYLAVFGRHAADSCLRRVAQAIRRCLRRASDVAGRIDSEEGDRLVVLSHASSKDGVTQFAGMIAESVRGLGLHHPRSRVDKFVTVTYHISIDMAGDNVDAGAFLKGAIGD